MRIKPLSLKSKEINHTVSLFALFFLFFRRKKREKGIGQKVKSEGRGFD